MIFRTTTTSRKPELVGGERKKITALETVRLAEFGNLIWLKVHTCEGFVGLGQTFFAPAAVRSISPGAAGFPKRARWRRWRKPGACRSRRATAPAPSCSAPRPGRDSAGSPRPIWRKGFRRLCGSRRASEGGDVRSGGVLAVEFYARLVSIIGGEDAAAATGSGRADMELRYGPTIDPGDHPGDRQHEHAAHERYEPAP